MVVVGRGDFPRHTCQNLETFLIATTGKWGVASASRGQRPRMVADILQCTREPLLPQHRTAWSQMAIVSRLRKACCGVREGLWNVRKEP